MTVSIWRYAHLLLAIVISGFLLVAAVTGVVLAVDAARQNTQPFRVSGTDSLSVAESVVALKSMYPELLELSVDHNGFVTAIGFDEEGNDFKSYINPVTGKVLGFPVEQSGFVQWNLALHRSLFLHETGRAIVGIVSFLFVLMIVSGTVLIIKRQQGLRHFFDKMTRDFLAQYYHVVAGRLLLLPMLIIAATGTYLFLARFDLLGDSASMPSLPTHSTQNVLQTLLLNDIKKLEFPIDDDPAEYYRLQLADRELTVHQVTGEIVEEQMYPVAKVWEEISLDLHTGRTHYIWAIVLGLVSLNIVGFIYSGFAITRKRIGTKTRNPYSAQDAEIVLLVGTENGSTLRFANQIHVQLLAAGRKSFLTELNKYTRYNSAQYLVVFTSTYGLGDAPSNASDFVKLLHTVQQQQDIFFSVVGFGSRTYADYCKFAVDIHNSLEASSWAKPLLPLYTVNDKSTEDFVHWVSAWSREVQVSLVTSPAKYGGKPPGLTKLKLLETTGGNPANQHFSMRFAPPRKINYRSGDLLAIYPTNDERERLYSISKISGRLELVVRWHVHGLGSNFLYQLKPGDNIRARIIPNPSFHFPREAPAVILIANGTGIAPFLGMITENRGKKPVHLFAGFRQETEQTKKYRLFCEAQIAAGNLTTLHFAFSREAEQLYVMDCIQQQAMFIANALQTRAVVMLCGSLAMQQDVEAVLDLICRQHNGVPLAYYRAAGQLLSDCY